METKRIVLICALSFLASLTPALYAQEKSGIRAVRQSAIEVETLPGKVSLDIKGMDIVDVLKILAMRGDLNIVAGKNVRGKVTLFLKNVDLMDDLEIT